ncbi:MAG TPA: DUF885 domain-containing protein [Candidatus Binatia bacterium]|nr:DUF885 domain-containing protein [Candidatus Binatia bacterium]
MVGKLLERAAPFFLGTAAVLVTAALPAAGIASPSSDLARLADEYWQGSLEAYPTMATSVGDKRYDDRLEDISPAGRDKDRKRLESVLARTRAIPEGGLSTQDRLTRTALLTEVENGLAYTSCGFEQWVVDPLGGPQVSLMNLPDYTIIETPKDAANFVKRMNASGRYVDAYIANLESGLREGKTASRAAVEKVIAQLERLAKTPDESLGVWKPAADPHAGWSASDRDAVTRDLRAAIDGTLRPALARLQGFLTTRVLPAARPPEKAGLAALPGGLDCYKSMIRVHTSLDLDPHALHQIGLDEVAKFRRDLAALGQRVLGTSDVAEIQRRLRTSPEMHFKTSAEVEAKARETLARAQAAVPAWFGKIQPKAPCEVRVMGMHEAPYSTIAYYREPSSDGKRPGTYMINTYLPETRPRYEAEALAFHESVPGHHLQIATAQELTGIPEFRKHVGVTAFVEGWGLYAERLASEMGLYTAGVDSIGILSFDAWRACRLVVDTGMHAEGWSREKAIQYMTENSVLAENNIENEVDRYLTWPGQALAYKVGQLEILKLRDEAKCRLGPRFDIKAFHDAVLGNGAVSLPVLRQQVEAYIAAAAGAP